MGWLTRKFDNLGSAFSGGCGGMSLSQAPAFTQAYLQRLGGHIDEARRTLVQIERGELLERLGPIDRQDAITQFSARVAELEKSFNAITESAPMMQPLVMFQHAETDIARRAWEHFTPAIPLDPASLVYTVSGVILALLLYELIKAPAEVMLHRRDKRKPAS